MGSIQTPGIDTGVSLYVNAPTTNNSLFVTIAQKFGEEVGDAKIDTGGTQNPVEAGVHTVEEIYLPSGLTVDNCALISVPAPNWPTRYAPLAC